MISDKTVALLTKLRMLCEKVVEDEGVAGAGRQECWMATAGLTDAITDIMSHLMLANSIEQRAVMVQKCDQDPADIVKDMLNIVNKETVN